MTLAEAIQAKSSNNCAKIHQVLQDDGVFSYITFRQPHFMRPLLNLDNLCDMGMQVPGNSGSFHYHGFLIKKPLNLGRTADK